MNQTAASLWHRRSRPEFVERYRATTSRAKPNLPRGVESFVVLRDGASALAELLA